MKFKSQLYISLKTLFEKVLAVFASFVLLPICCLIAVLIKLDSKGPILFKQKRIGKNFKPFTIFKFRTMTHQRIQKGLYITHENDSRITAIGKYLRKYKIDEIPQLLNVILGDMSFIGPRPEVEKYVKLFTNDYTDILKVLPGITDWASIEFIKEQELLSCHQDKEKAYIEQVLPKKIYLAKKYVNNVSLNIDIKIFFKTIQKIFI